MAQNLFCEERPDWTNIEVFKLKIHVKKHSSEKGLSINCFLQKNLQSSDKAKRDLQPHIDLTAIGNKSHTHRQTDTEINIRKGIHKNPHPHPPTHTSANTHTNTSTFTHTPTEIDQLSLTPSQMTSTVTDVKGNDTANAHLFV